MRTMRIAWRRSSKSRSGAGLQSSTSEGAPAVPTAVVFLVLLNIILIIRHWHKRSCQKSLRARSDRCFSWAICCASYKPITRDEHTVQPATALSGTQRRTCPLRTELYSTRRGLSSIKVDRFDFALPRHRTLTFVDQLPNGS